MLFWCRKYAAAGRGHWRARGELLLARYALPPEVQVIDGGTGGMELLESLEDADKLIIVDCVRVGKPPATLIRRG